MKIEKTEYKLFDKTTECICISDINTIEELDEAIEPIMDDIRAHFYWADIGEGQLLYGFEFVLYNGINPNLTKEEVYKSLVFHLLHSSEENVELTLYNYDKMGLTPYWDTHPDEMYHPEIKYEIRINKIVVNALYQKYKEFGLNILDLMSVEEARKIVGANVVFKKRKKYKLIIG